MYKIAKTMTISFFGLLAFTTHPIKITNSTTDNLLYCCGNPANKNIVLVKQELNASATAEVLSTQDYIQIYTQQKPTTLSGKYPLANQTEDLTIVKHSLLGYTFKPTAKLGQDEPKKIPQMYGTQAPKLVIVQDRDMTKPYEGDIETSLQSAGARQKKSTSLQHPSKDRPQNKGRRVPSRKKRPTNTNQITDSAAFDDRNTNNAEPSTVHYNSQIASSNNELPGNNKTNDSCILESMKPLVAILPLVPVATAHAKKMGTLKKKAIVIPNKQASAKPNRTSYFTKKKLALALGTIATASLIVWWWRTLKTPVI